MVQIFASFAFFAANNLHGHHSPPQPPLFILPISRSTIHRYHSPCRNRPLRVRDPWGSEHAERKRVPRSSSGNLRGRQGNRACGNSGGRNRQRHGDKKSSHRHTILNPQQEACHTSESSHNIRLRKLEIRMARIRSVCTTDTGIICNGRMRIPKIKDGLQQLFVSLSHP